MKASSMQKPVLNLLADYNMDSTWKTAHSGSAPYTVTKKTDTGHIGNTSYEVTQNDANGVSAIYQTLTLSKGTYTLSAYLKSKDIGAAHDEETGAGIWIDQKNASGATIRQDMERSLTGTTDSEFDNGWVRLTLTFTVAENNTKAEVFAGIANTTGTVWIDSMQLETGEVANKLNLIKNSGFQSTTNGKLDHWSFSETPAGSGVGSPPAIRRRL